jgi:Flp pilus assembly pilin Flp
LFDIRFFPAHTFVEAWGAAVLLSANIHSNPRNNNHSQKGRARPMLNLAKAIWSDEGQDIAEYAVLLAVILIIVVGTVRLIGSNANTVFSQAASSIQ